MVKRRLRPIPTESLRAEFGARALQRAAASVALRVLAFAALCALGTTFLMR